MKSWLRVTLPQDGFVAGLLLSYVLVEVVFPLLTQMMWGVAVDHPIGELIVRFATFVYAAHRVLSFHPAFRPDYRQWLETTPWTSRHPLPVGPIHLVAQDVLVLAVLAGAAWARHPRVSPAHLILMFLVVYEFVLMMSFALLRMPWFAYTIGFGLGLVALLWQTPRPALGVAAAVYSISYAGLRRALERFERWDLSWMNEQPLFSMSQEKAVDRMRQNVLGWPFDIIRPRDVAASITYREGIMLSVLAGWWCFVALQKVDPLAARIVGNMAVGFACQFAVIGRVATYCWGYAPPIGLWGRIFTLRWIIPGYDYVFIPPLLALSICGVGISAQTLFNVPVEIAAPLTLTLVFVITLTSAPTLLYWRLTGNHRLSPGTLMANKRAEVTQV
jgi:hypothetical protein